VFRRRDPCILFMDEGFGYKELAPQLRVLGYEIKCHQEHHNKKQGVEDDENIAICAENNWLLTTTDKNLVLRYRDLLKKHKQSVVFTSNNKKNLKRGSMHLRKRGQQLSAAGGKCHPLG
jgi:uncharacterized protein with PIN domain